MPHFETLVEQNTRKIQKRSMSTGMDTGGQTRLWSGRRSKNVIDILSFLEKILSLYSNTYQSILKKIWNLSVKVIKPTTIVQLYIMMQSNSIIHTFIQFNAFLALLFVCNHPWINDLRFEIKDLSFRFLLIHSLCRMVLCCAALTCVLYIFYV